MRIFHAAPIALPPASLPCPTEAPGLGEGARFGDRRELLEALQPGQAGKRAAPNPPEQRLRQER